jgi:hypothetical protein
MTNGKIFMNTQYRISFLSRHILKVLILGLLFFPLIFSFVLKKVNAQEYVLQSKSTEHKNSGRMPASFVPNDDVEMAPIEQELWINRIMIEDDAGVLTRIQQNLRAWEETDEHARNWNLTSTGLFVTPTDDQRRSYLNREILQYIDKRVSGEVRRAEEGSALHTVGQVQEALKPNTTVEVSPLLKMRFRARVIQREVTLLVENPWVECNAKANLKGDLELNFAKNLDFGVRANVFYKISEGYWVTSFSRAITNNVTGVISSYATDNQMAFSDEADTSIQLVFSQAF